MKGSAPQHRLKPNSSAVYIRQPDDLSRHKTYSLIFSSQPWMYLNTPAACRRVQNALASYLKEINVKHAGCFRAAMWGKEQVLGLDRCLFLHAKNGPVQA